MNNMEYNWTDNPTESGVSPCNTDVLNECLMHLKYNNEGNGSGLSLFDVVEKDHVLTLEESKGYAPLGSFVYKEPASSLRYGYPDFYNKCLEEKNDGIETELQLEDNTITVYKHSNGHIFYDIADKETVDLYYIHNGACWMYGIDEENERVFLPRNDWFTMNGKSADVGKFIEAGLPNITGTFGGVRDVANTPTGAFYRDGISSQSPGAGSNTSQIALNASRSSSVYGNSDTVQPPAVKKLVYMVVGNTEVTSSIINVTEITTSENDTIPLFTAQYFDFTPNNLSWLKAGEQKNNGGIYTTAYNTLVNCLTENTYNLKVIDVINMVEGVDYSEYWKIDQTNMTFTTPTRISYFAFSKDELPVISNGKPIQYTDGTFSNTAQIYRSGNALNINTSVGASTALYAAAESGLKVDLSNAKSEEVQLYFKVANAVENLELLDVGEILDVLTDKVSFSNTEWAANTCMPDYSAGVNITLPYTAPMSGVVYINNWTRGETNIKINGAQVARCYQGGNETSVLLPIGMGETVTIASGGVSGAIFYPLKGANND